MRCSRELITSGSVADMDAALGFFRERMGFTRVKAAVGVEAGVRAATELSV
jgi:catechol 2,3-dioxygenase-like lactoylglutathione lyase family enzyme